jgi:c-di-GMP-binding flagellar brake protein YcgR
MSSSSPKTAVQSRDRRRRRHVRYRADFPVTVNLLVENKYQRLQGHCRDLSEAGVGILVAAELSSGEVASLNFSFPESDQQWSVRAVVRHTRGYHYGFEFLSLGEEQRNSLASYVRSLASVSGTIMPESN